MSQLMTQLPALGPFMFNGIDPDYQAVLSRGTALGYTLPGTGVQAKGNALVKALKACGVWDMLDVFYVFATDGDSGFATLNWKDPALYQCTLINSPSFTAMQGFTGDGMSSYISTNFNKSIDAVRYTLNDASRSMYVYDIGSGVGGRAIDGDAATGYNNLMAANTANQKINALNNLSVNFSVTTDNMQYCINRSSGSDIQFFEGTSMTTYSSNSYSIGLVSILLKHVGNYGAHTISMYALGASMFSKNTAFVNAFSKYMT